MSKQLFLGQGKNAVQLSRTIAGIYGPGRKGPEAKADLGQGD